MAITRAQQAKQMLQNGGMLVQPGFGGKRQGYRGDDAARSSEGTSAGRADPGRAGRGDTRGDPGRADDRGTREQNRNQRNITRDAREREKIKKQIAKGPTLGKIIKRNPLVQTASFFSNPLGFIGRKIMDERRAKRVNELFGIDDNLDYTGADMGFVVSQPPKPEFPTGGGDDGPQQIIPPTKMIAGTPYQEDLIEDENLSAIQRALLERERMGGARAFAAEGGPVGGIMDLETGRQMYFLGKLVKKATRAIKKIGKSPIGKAALAFGAYKLGKMPFGESETSLFDRGFEFYDSMDRADKLKLGIGAALTAAPLFFQDDNNDEEYQKFASQSGPGLPAAIPDIRKNYRDYMARAFVADGGRIGYSEGDLSQDKIYKKWVERYEKNPESPLVTMHENFEKYKNFYESSKNEKADGGIMRLGYQEGSKEPVAKKTMPLLDMDGKEMDLREDGGFVPIGRMEKADDVPARLSKNEFVFTADAVRNAGEGDIDKGAEVMYNMMKNLEAGGEVSEESQGLDGARKMFQTSQRLEEVL